MIPKKIHYCWFGNSEISEDVQVCIDSWRKYMPDYEIIQWNEKNYPIEGNIDYIQEAYANKKWAFVSDYARLDIIYKHGGIYLDTDVEVIKSFDQLLEHKAFFGMEEPGRVATGLGFGSEKGSMVIKELRDVYKNIHFLQKNKISDLTCIELALPVFKHMGITERDIIHKLNNFVVVYPTEYFCPINFSGKGNVTKNSFSIHHYSSSWKKNIFFEKQIIILKIFLRTWINSHFGNGTYEKIKNSLKRRG